MKTILITGIGGLTPRSIATILRKNHPGYHLIGIDINKKRHWFFHEAVLLMSIMYALVATRQNTFRS